VTTRALVGLAALNAGFAVTGLAVLYAVRGFRHWTDVARLSGLGYLLGVAAFGVVWTQFLVVGVPFGGWAIVLTLVAGTAAGCAAGVAFGRPRPRWTGRSGVPQLSTQTLLVTAVGIASAGLLLEAFFRSARLQSLQAFDAWAFWVPKAKAIYFFGGLDEQVFTTSAGPTYPPLVPILDAAAFHAMGSVDTISLHLQFWFLVVGAVAALAGCLYRHAPAWALWPSLLAVLVVPRFGERLLTPQADVLVDVFFVVAALLLALWLRDGRGWRLAVVAVLLGGATLTKREGLLFAVVALGAAFVAAPGRRRQAWRPLAVVLGVVAAAAIPWRLWYRAQDIGGEAPGELGSGLDRVVDALNLSADVLLDTSLWSIVPFLFVLALAIAFVWGDQSLASFFALLAGAAFIGGAWVTYSYGDLPITADEALNPIVRYTGAIILLAAGAMPLLVGSAWRTTDPDDAP
jgi:hypothetical protein